MKTENERKIERKTEIKKLKSKLKGKYLHIICETPWTTKYCMFQRHGLYILFEQKRKTGETKESIITAAAKLIKTELRDLEKMNNVYPTFD